MKLTGRKDVEAPADFVFSTLTDFESWERFAMRRGLDVSRTDTLARAGVGMGWLTRFNFRGKSREARIDLVEMTPATVVKLRGNSANIDADVVIEVVEMAARRCRMHVSVDSQPRTLGARLFLQSLRLAKARVDRRFDGRMEALAREIETRYRRGPPKA